MSEADRLFEELGYEKKIENEDFLRYDNKDNPDDTPMKICFSKYFKTFTKVRFLREEAISMQELKAINKKCLELGWL